MRKCTKKSTAILLAAILAVGCLTGCGNTTEKKPGEGSVLSEASENQKDLSEENKKDDHVTTDPITISVFFSRNSHQAGDPDELWIFDYLEYWLAEQGYDVTFDLRQSMEPADQISLMFGTDDVADLIIGPALTTSQMITYGMEEGMLLDWTPYLNEEYMPNVMKLAADDPDALTASTCIDGKVYSLPTFKDRGWGWAAGNFPGCVHLFMDTKVMERLNLEFPDTFDGFIDMLRVIKENTELENGQEVIPLISINSAPFIENFIWTSLGYYGGNWGNNRYGTEFMIKDGEVWFPAMTEDYEYFIQYMKTMYDEGLISKDHFTMDDSTARGLYASGVCAVLGDNGIEISDPEEAMEWTAVPAMTAGDNDTVVASVNATYAIGTMWASADTEYPEVLAHIVDYLYSEEGSTYYYYGPMKGTDPLGKLEGWWYDEDGIITNAEVVNGEYESYDLYAQKYVYPQLQVANYIDYTAYSQKLAGLDNEPEIDDWPDAILGGTYECVWKANYELGGEGHFRVDLANAWKNNVTTVVLPAVYMSEEDSTYASEIAISLNEYVATESAKFITGIRPVSEIGKFQEELKKLGAEEYISLYKEAYSTYINAVFE